MGQFNLLGTKLQKWVLKAIGNFTPSIFGETKMPIRFIWMERIEEELKVISSPLVYISKEKFRPFSSFLFTWEDGKKIKHYSLCFVSIFSFFSLRPNRVFGVCYYSIPALALIFFLYNSAENRWG